MIINGNEPTAIILIILTLSIAIDLIFGELPTRFHPVVFIGKTIEFFSKQLINIKSRVAGLVLTTLVSITSLAIFGLILFLASYNIFLFVVIATIIFSSTFSIKMLLSSAKQIKKDLETGLDIARKSMSYLVSRDTSELSEELIISATIETLSENITDSAIAPIFYYILTNIIIITILGCLVAFNLLASNIATFSNTVTISIAYISISIPSPIFITIIAILVAILYRVINTLDAMVGYKNEKYINIGYFPAKVDDILNYIPARFGGIAVVLASKFYKRSGMDWKNSYKIMKRDARKPPSPNSGFTMAAVAGALNISLVKEGVYIIGDNRSDSDNNTKLKREDIEKSVKLSKSVISLAIIFLILIFLTFSIIMLFL